jgi:hypothetical protein
VAAVHNAPAPSCFLEDNNFIVKGLPRLVPRYLNRLFQSSMAYPNRFFCFVFTVSAFHFSGN